ncbi:MAG: hypothetical protein IJ160_08560 [Muribaculaceae bacterium]|nr:hypothetical protein [Muribaculaceae bacterium]
MTNNNSHTSALFHYTRNQNIIFGILREGLKFSYCKEKFSANLCLGIPMISFCDIPISHSSEHSSKYGQYAIALSKENLMSKYKGALNPVNYFTSISSVEAAFRLKDEAINSKQKLNDISRNAEGKEVTIKIDGAIYKGKGLGAEHVQDVLQLFFNSINYHHYATQAIGFMKAYQSQHNGKNQINYDECEWRIVLPENAKLEDKTLCKWFWNENEYDNWRNNREDKFVHGMSLLFTVDDIEYIIVPNKDLIPNFIKRLIKLKSLCGQELNNRERYSLVSKVISLEQIKRDF